MYSRDRDRTSNGSVGRSFPYEYLEYKSMCRNGFGRPFRKIPVGAMTSEVILFMHSSDITLLLLPLYSLA